MLEITTAIFLTLMGSAVFHLIPAKIPRLRMGFVTVMSFFIVFAFHPLAALAATGSGIFAWLLYLLGQCGPKLQKYAPFSLIALLLIFSIEDFDVATNIYATTLVQFGMSFYVLRLYLALRTSASRRETVGLEEFLTIALFFPIFAAGPICAQEAFSRSTLRDNPLLHNYLVGFLRIGIGIFSLYFITAMIDKIEAPLTEFSGYLIDWPRMSSLATYLVMVLNFADLYANFAGYTEIAIGLGLFFGFQIPENFKYPFLATNIHDFWRRWLLSLSRFITTQIYMPLMLTLRKPRLCMFLAFTLVGMWHKVNLQYLVWGMGHGLMLVSYMTFSKSPAHTAITERVTTKFWALISWTLTISMVSFLSTFANQPDLDQALAFCRSLLLGS